MLYLYITHYATQAPDLVSRVCTVPQTGRSVLKPRDPFACYNGMHVTFAEQARAGSRRERKLSLSVGWKGRRSSSKSTRMIGL
eukprot:scaffold44420_cov25-Tisochrysis_lutea.AAC.1